MITPENLIALIMVAALIIYVLTGGADFGGGVWDLFAQGKRSQSQRNLIAAVLAPIWESNHIWLILLVVLMFVCFPLAYSRILTFLHFPTTIMLFGIVLRGSAFVFRKYDEGSDRLKRLWSVMFAIGSVITPFFLGVILGAITIEQADTTDLVFSWLKPFPIFCGVLTLVICAYLAAIYLIIETSDQDLQGDFRMRALIAGGALLICTLAGTWISYFEARYLFYELTKGSFAVPLQILTAITAILAIFMLIRRRYRLARYFAVGQVAFIMFGWMITQYPDLITGQLTIAEAAAPRNVLVTTLIILAIGSCLLAPALLYLFKVFRRRRT